MCKQQTTNDFSVRSCRTCTKIGAELVPVIRPEQENLVTALAQCGPWISKKHIEQNEQIQDNTRDYKSTARYCQLKIQTPFCTRFFAHFNDFSSFQTHFTCLLLRSLASTRGGLLHFRTFLTTVAFPRQIFSSEKDKRQRHKRKTCLAAQELYCTLQHFLLH